MALQLRRGTNAQRLAITPLEGELVFVTNWDAVGVPALWIGDGITPGGVIAGSMNLDDLRDVEITSAANGSVLLYSNGVWIDTLNLQATPTNYNNPTYNISGVRTSVGDVIALGINKNKNAAAVSGDTVSQTFGLNKDANTAVPAIKLQAGIDSNRIGNLTVLGYDLDDYENSELKYLQIDQNNLTSRVKRLGIGIAGTAFPTTELDVRFRDDQGDDAGEIRLAAASDVIRGLSAYYTTSTDRGSILSYNQNTGSRTERIRMNKEGTNAIIGELTLSDSLFVEGSADVSGYLTVDNDISTRSIYASNSLVAGKADSSTVFSTLELRTIDGSFFLHYNTGDDLVSFNYANGGGNRLQFDPTNQWFNTGNLGIRTTTPAYPLDVNGDARVVNTLHAGYIDVDTDISVNSLYANISVQAGEFGATNVSRLNVDSGQPLLQLLNADGEFRLTNHSGDDLVSAYWNGSNRLQFSPTEQWFNTGNLGINTNNPEYTLDVNGGARIANNLLVSGNLTVSGTTTTVNSETVTIADNIVLLNSNVTGTPTENSGIEIERGTSDNVAWQWNETSDYWETTGTTTNVKKIRTDSYLGKDLQLDDYLIYTNRTSGNRVGIATFDPQNTLDVNGSIRARTNLFAGVFNVTAPYLQIDNTEGYLRLTNDANTDLVTLNWSNRGGDRLQFNTTDQWFNTGKLGVGTATPAEALDVVGNGKLTGNLYLDGSTITLNNANATPSGDYSITVKRGGLGDVQIYWDETNDHWTITNPITVDELTVAGNRIYSSTGNALELLGNDVQVVGKLTTGNYAEYNSTQLATSTTDPDQVVWTTTNPVAKVVISISSGGEYQSTEILMVTNGTTASMTQYADIATNGTLATFSVDYSGGSMRLLATPVNATTTIKVATTAIV